MGRALLQTTEADLHQAELVLDHTEWMFDLRADAGLMVADSTSANQALEIGEDLEAIEIKSHRETIGRERNPLFGLAQADRIGWRAAASELYCALPLQPFAAGHSEGKI